MKKPEPLEVFCFKCCVQPDEPCQFKVCRYDSASGRWTDCTYRVEPGTFHRERVSYAEELG